MTVRVRECDTLVFDDTVDAVVIGHQVAQTSFRVNRYSTVTVVCSRLRDCDGGI